MKKFKVNSFKMNELKKRGLSLILAFTMLGGIVVLSRCSRKRDIYKDIDTDAIITDIYEEDSIESDVLRYIGISENLNKLDLGEFILDEEITIELDTPENIQKYIDNYDSRNLTCLRYLKMQEELVNSYIYSTGYKIAYLSASEATKKYAGEFYGLEDYKNIKFNYFYPHEYNVNNHPGEENIYMKYGPEYNKKSLEVTDKYIINGVRAMANSQTNSDPNENDDNLYNNDRNETIKKSIIIAEYLDQQVENNDLYNEKAAKKIKR